MRMMDTSQHMDMDLDISAGTTYQRNIIMTVDVTTYQYRVQYLRTRTDGEPRTREPKKHLGVLAYPFYC
jgi:hypothetical protein